MHITRTLALLVALTTIAGCHLSYTSDKGWHDPTQNAVSQNPAEHDEPAVGSGLSNRVALFRVTIDRNLQKVFTVPQVHKAWKQKFKNSSGYSVVRQKNVDRAEKNEAKGKYIYFEIGDATRVHLNVGTRTRWKSAQGKPVQATQLVLTAKVGKRGELQTITVDGMFVGFEGKVFPDSTFQKKLIENELQAMFDKVCAHIGG